MLIIKEFNINEYTYKLGYYLFQCEIYPRIEIDKYNKYIGAGEWTGKWNKESGKFFDFYLPYTEKNSFGSLATIEEMFIELRTDIEIPERIEKEYEKMFLLYKLNNFKEI